MNHVVSVDLKITFYFSELSGTILDSRIVFCTTGWITPNNIPFPLTFLVDQGTGTGAKSLILRVRGDGSS